MSLKTTHLGSVLSVVSSIQCVKFLLTVPIPVCEETIVKGYKYIFYLPALVR